MNTLDVIYPIKIYQPANLKNILLLTIFFNDSCNYNCWYCYNIENNKTRKNKYIDIKLLEHFIKYILFLTNKDIQIIILGGEPTLHPQLFEFCNYCLLLKKINIAIFSNFSASINLYKTLIVLHNVKFILTYHNLNVNSFNIFSQKIYNLKKVLNFNLIKNNIKWINIMLDKNNFYDILNYYNIVKTENSDIEVNCHLLCEYNKELKKRLYLTTYTNDEINEYYKYAKKEQNDLSIVKFNNNTIKKIKMFNIKNTNKNQYCFKFWLCNAGQDAIYIDLNGNIYPCTNMLKSTIGNINNLHIKLKKTICLSNFCTNKYEIEKEKIFKK